MDVRVDRNRQAGEILDELDRIEGAIRQKYPAIKHLYIEPEPADDGKRRSPSPDRARAER